MRAASVPSRTVAHRWLNRQYSTPPPPDPNPLPPIRPRHSWIIETINTCTVKHSEPQTPPRMVHRSPKWAMDLESLFCTPPPYFQGLEGHPACPLQCVVVGGGAGSKTLEE